MTKPNYTEDNCIYPGCKLKCRNIKHHRAKYATLMYKRRKQKKEMKKKVQDQERSTKINWDQLEKLGILI